MFICIYCNFCNCCNFFFQSVSIYRNTLCTFYFDFIVWPFFKGPLFLFRKWPFFRFFRKTHTVWVVTINIELINTLLWYHAHIFETHMVCVKPRPYEFFVFLFKFCSLLWYHSANYYFFIQVRLFMSLIGVYLLIL